MSIMSLITTDVVRMNKMHCFVLEHIWYICMWWEITSKQYKTMIFVLHTYLLAWPSIGLQTTLYMIHFVLLLVSNLMDNIFLKLLSTLKSTGCVLRILFITSCSFSFVYSTIYIYICISCVVLCLPLWSKVNRDGGLFWWVSYFSNRYPTFSLLSQLSWLPHLSLWNNRKQEGGPRCLYTQKNKRTISGQREHGARTEEQWMKPMFIILGWMAVAWGTVFYPLLLILLIIIIASPSFISHIFCSPFSITTPTLHPSLN